MKHKTTKYSVSVVFCVLELFSIHTFAEYKEKEVRDQIS